MDSPRNAHRHILERGQPTDDRMYNVNGRYILNLMAEARATALEEARQAVDANLTKGAKAIKRAVDHIAHE